MSEEVNETQYADALSTFSDAQIVIFGIPFDATCSHRPGTAQAPAAIRKESYNYETYLNRYDFNTCSLLNVICNPAFIKICTHRKISSSNERQK